MATGTAKTNTCNPGPLANTAATFSDPAIRSEPVIPLMATSTTNESSGISAVGNRTSPAKQAIDSQDSHLSLLGHNTLANNGAPPLKKIRVGNATSHPLANAPQSNLGNQVSFEVPEGQESDDGIIHINSLVARVDAPDKGPSNIPVVDLADCSDDETYAEAIEKDDDDDGSREYSISPSGDAVNTSSMTIPLPNLAPDELNLFGWFDNKTASRVKNRLARALRPYVPPPPLPAGQKRPPGRPKKNPVPVPVATTPAKRGRPRKNPLPAPVTTPRKRGRPKKVVGSTTSLSATTATTTPVATTRTAHVWTTPTVRRARAASL